MAGGRERACGGGSTPITVTAHGTTCTNGGGGGSSFAQMLAVTLRMGRLFIAPSLTPFRRFSPALVGVAGGVAPAAAPASPSPSSSASSPCSCSASHPGMRRLRLLVCASPLGGPLVLGGPLPPPPETQPPPEGPPPLVAGGLTTTPFTTRRCTRPPNSSGEGTAAGRMACVVALESITGISEITAGTVCMTGSGPGRVWPFWRPRPPLPRARLPSSALCATPLAPPLCSSPADGEASPFLCRVVERCCGASSS
mmetsp:Transcript_37714/g.99698  ORF Transcript_37714/g.99698 Transcript_37714/m.99698 type:complete len:254 (+) Transcript_37714:708-1469(+)